MENETHLKSTCSFLIFVFVFFKYMKSTVKSHIKSLHHTMRPNFRGLCKYKVKHRQSSWEDLTSVFSSHAVICSSCSLWRVITLRCWNSGFQAFMGSSLTFYHLFIICSLRVSVAAPCLSEPLQLLAAVTTPRSVNQLEVPRPKLKGRGDKVLSISPHTDAGTQ